VDVGVEDLSLGADALQTVRLAEGLLELVGDRPEGAALGQVPVLTGQLDLVEDRQQTLEHVVGGADLDVRTVAVHAPLVVDVLRLQPLQVREALLGKGGVRVDLRLALRRRGGGLPFAGGRDVDLLLDLGSGLLGRHLGVHGLVLVGHLFSSSSTTSASTTSSSWAPDWSPAASSAPAPPASPCSACAA